MKIKALNQHGLSHYLLPLAIVLVVAIGGTYLQVTSHAAPASRSKHTARFHRLTGSNLNQAKQIANQYWGGRICGTGGKDIRIIWYDNRNYYQHLAHAPDLANANPKIQEDYDHSALAYTFNGAGLYRRHNPNYCRIYMNTETIASDYSYWDHR